MSELPYRNILGCVLYIAKHSRPDICKTVNLLSQFHENPGIKYWNVLLRLLGYIKNTQNYVANLSKIENLEIDCFCDSDFATKSLWEALYYSSIKFLFCGKHL